MAHYIFGEEQDHVLHETGVIETEIRIGTDVFIKESFYPLCGMEVETEACDWYLPHDRVIVQPNTFNRRIIYD